MTNTSPNVPDIGFVIEGDVSDAARSRATEMVGDLADRSPRPVIFARVKLLRDTSRPPGERCMAQATLDVSGVLLRAQVVASGMIEAINLLDARLQRRVRDLADRRDSANTRPPSAGSGTWRHGDLPGSQPAYFPRPPTDREIVRRKTWAGHQLSVSDALFDLYVLDHRFFLFTDEIDGVDCIVFETPDGLRLRRLDGGTPPPDEIAELPVEVVASPAPSMSIDDAVQRLDTSDEPFVFYHDADTDRGCVLYRRYDGHYGLIEPD